MKGRIKFLSAVLTIFILFAGFSAFAQVKTQTLVKKPRVPDLKIVLKVDLLIDWIWAENCPCFNELTKADVIYVNGTMGVVVRNDGPNNSKAKLEVKYWDVKQNKEIIYNATFTLNRYERKWIQVRAGKFLIKKSYGVTAKILSDNGSVTTIETKPENNQKTSSMCLGKTLIL